MSMGDDSFETGSTISGSSRDAGSTSSGGGNFPAVDAVIAAFGGIRPMATKLGISFTTVQGWKTRGQIPTARWPEVEAAATANGIDLAALPASSVIDLDSESTDTTDYRHLSGASAMPEDYDSPSRVSVVFTTIAPGSGSGTGYSLISIGLPVP